MRSRIVAGALALIVGSFVPVAAQQIDPLAVPEGEYPAQGYPWENNNLGLEPIVPEPWTPVVLDGDRAQVWGREFALANGPLPAQITSQGTELFVEPPTLALTVDGAAVAWTGGPATATDVRAEWGSTGEVAGCRVLAETSLEFDGFVRVDVTVTPGGAATVDGLRLTLPFAPGVAEMFSRYIDYDFNVQRLDRGDFARSFGHCSEGLSTKWYPTLWLGNHDVGLEWSCETNATWAPMESDRSLRIEPSADSVRAVFEFVAEPVTLTAPTTWSFALYPTPVKPLPDDWRRIVLTNSWVTGSVMNAQNHDVYGIGWHNWFPLACPGMPVLEPATAPSAREMSTRGREPAELLAEGLARVREFGAEYVPYGALYVLAATLPRGEWDHYADAWRIGRPQGSMIVPNWALLQGIPPRQPSAYYICLSPKSVRDFIVWYNVQAIEDYGVGGLYFDLAAPNTLCMNPAHDHPASVDGVQYYPLWWQREIMKRLWIACKQKNPDHLISIHHAKTPITAAGFADMVLSGEALNMFFRSDNFVMSESDSDPSMYVPDYSHLPDVLYEVAYSQRTGVINELLPEVIKWNRTVMRDDPERLAYYTRTLLARVVAYGIPVYPSAFDMKLFDDIQRGYERFGWLEGTRFVGPWESAPLLGEAEHALSIALHLRPGGESVLLAVANLTDGPLTETLRPDVAALREASSAIADGPVAVDAITGEPVAGDAASGWSVSVPPQNYRLLLLGPE